MPPAKSNENPPPTMTWAKAAPVIAVSATFDVLRIACDLLWFFAPLIIGSGTASAVSSATGSQTLGYAAGIITGGLSVLGMPFFVALGTILAMAVGMMGWLILVFTIMLTNTRLIREIFANPMHFLLGLGATQIPFISAIPVLTLTAFRLYRKQISMEKAALQAWQMANQSQLVAAQDAQMQRALALRRALAEEEATEEIPDGLAEFA